MSETKSKSAVKLHTLRSVGLCQLITSGQEASAVEDVLVDVFKTQDCEEK